MSSENKHAEIKCGAPRKSMNVWKILIYIHDKTKYFINLMWSLR